MNASFSSTTASLLYTWVPSVEVSAESFSSTTGVSSSADISEWVSDGASSFDSTAGVSSTVSSAGVSVSLFSSSLVVSGSAFSSATTWFSISSSAASAEDGDTKSA